ncbi:hypothetical protein [Mesorhizobium sp.]|uniref:hypothetical protein n=1 Tax=Mesorhizobium sp. TaxID=1871066 RepID=UPI00120A46F6|nr:hypothetical protein [Mesorhizobium sp.]TIS98324.1 MAG: hypothetical protein E5W87_24890 [Mesorhizobium sp.]
MPDSVHGLNPFSLGDYLADKPAKEIGMIPDRPADVFADALSRLDDEALRLHFDSENDALDYFKEIANDFYGRLRAEKTDIAKAYADGGVYLNLHFRTGLKPHVRQFSVHVFPFRGGRDRGIGDVAIPKADAAAADCHGLKYPMNLLITKLVKLPDGFFPSLVWLESEEERSNRYRNLIPLVSIQIGAGISGGLPKGELGPARFWVAAECPSTIVDSVVKGRPQTIDNIEGDHRKLVAKIGDDFDLAACLAGLWIDVGKETVWLFGENSALDMLELVEVFECAGDEDFAALEGFQHARDSQEV